MPIGLEVADSSFEGEMLEETHKLDDKAGETINFWVRNNSECDVELTINDESNRVIEAGGQGHISLEAKDFMGFIDRKYTFKVVPTEEDNEINIDYRIAQRFSEEEDEE